MLTVRFLDSLKPDPGGKIRRHSDAHGLYVAHFPAGALYFRYDYTIAGKRKTLSLGTYPETKLEEARGAHVAARQLVKAGIDPSAVRQLAKHAAREEAKPATASPGPDAGPTFAAVMDGWITRKARALAAVTAEQTRARLEKYLRHTIGPIPIADLTTQTIWQALEPIESRPHQAHRLRQHIAEILEYASGTGRAPREPIKLKGALMPLKPKHYARLRDVNAIGALLLAIDETPGITPIVRAAMQLMPYVFVRSAELREARWEEINLEAGLWRIPIARMKSTSANRQDASDSVFCVPLSTQARAILERLRAEKSAPLVFPSLRARTRAISDMTLTATLRRLGYTGDQMQIHGFRSIASTRLREKPLGFPNDAIELQLAHRSFKDTTRAAYDEAELLETRIEMMQAYADYLDTLRDAARRPAA